MEVPSPCAPSASRTPKHAHTCTARALHMHARPYVHTHICNTHMIHLHAHMNARVHRHALLEKAPGGHSDGSCPVGWGLPPV